MSDGQWWENGWWESKFTYTEKPEWSEDCSGFSAYKELTKYAGSMCLFMVG
jgi:hypothetical protein